MSDLVHVANSLVCPKIKFNPERDTHDAWESIDFLLIYLNDFGYQHCIYGCVRCLDRMRDDNKRYLPPEPSGNYSSAFSDLHNAFGQLPANLYDHLSNISNSDCPACAVLTALQQFPIIARYSGTKPVDWDTLPCYFEDDMDERCNHFWNSVRHIEALRHLDLSKLPSRMPPAERRDAKARLAPGKAVVEFIHAFHNRQAQLPPTMSDDELWAVFACSDQIRTLNENNLFVSSRWKSWAKDSILNGDNGTKGAFVSRVALVAFDCFHNIRVARENANIGMWIPDASEYSIIRAILTAAYFYSSGIALSEQGCDVWFEKTAQGFIALDRDDFGKRYYALSALGRALALRYGGSPPPFLRQEAERESGPTPRPTPPPVIVTTTDVIDNDITANLNTQAAASGGEGGKGGKGGDAKAINAPNITAAPIAQTGDTTINNNMPNPADFVREFRGLLDDEHRRRETSAVPSPPGMPSGDDPLPPLDSRVSRADLAAKLGKGTDTLKGWEDKGQGPGGVFWPKAEVTPNNAYYNFREVWQSFLSLLPNTDRIQQVALIEGLSITKRP